MSDLNVLRLDYMDWFERKRQTFVDALKLLQMNTPQDMSHRVATVGNFRNLFQLASRFPRRGFPVDGCAAIIGKYLEFWNRLVSLQKQGQCLHKKVNDYCKSVTKMREPQINKMANELQNRLNEEASESLNFMSVRHSSDNLFTYKVAQYDHQYHGLLSYIPYLLRISTTICLLYSKMSLEKE